MNIVLTDDQFNVLKNEIVANVASKIDFSKLETLVLQRIYEGARSQKILQNVLQQATKTICDRALSDTNFDAIADNAMHEAERRISNQIKDRLSAGVIVTFGGLSKGNTQK